LGSMTTIENNRCVDLEDIPGFEGPEKKIEVDYILSSQTPEGLRKVPVDDWKILLTEINCTILSHIENEFCDAYILSESSLFVFASKVIIKTCGQITLLKCLPLLLEYGTRVNAIETRVSFSRRNLLFPDEQFSPHTSFDEEVLYLKQHFPTGDAYIFGSKNCDHHYMFVYHNENVALPSKAPHSIEVLMTGLDRKVMRQFYRDDNFVSVEELTERSKIQSLFKKTAIIDAHAFEPLGFSLNGLESDCYATLHITPQPECSYVSFETTDVDFKASHDLVAKVIDIFRPEAFTVLVISESMPFEVGAFSNFVPRGSAHHDFVGTGNFLSWYSYKDASKATPEVSPLHSLNSSSISISAQSVLEERGAKMLEEELSKIRTETFAH